MARIPIHNVGSVGVVKDKPAHLLPPEAWSDARNVRFRDGIAYKSLGHEDVFGTPSAAPYWSMPVTDVANVFWMYASLTKMYATDGTTHAEITRTVGGDYSTTEDRLWNGGILGGIAVVTNGVDKPQFWATAGLGADLADLTNWPATHLCRIIRPFKQHLVALNITESGTSYPHRVLWSHPADPGSVPVSWDITDPTKDAGQQDLSDSNFGAIIGAKQLRDILVIYKERSTWGMQYIGGAYIFRLFSIFDGIGLLNEKCVTSFNDGAKHFIATGEDIMLHNGQEPMSLLNNRWKRWLTRNIDSTYSKRAFVVENPREHEVWFCFPEVGSSYPTLALVWNSHENTVAVRELSGGISHIALGPIPGSGGGVWDSDTGTWNSDTAVWDAQTFIGNQARLLQSNKNTTNLQLLDSTEQFDGTNMTAYLEREGLAYIGQDRQGQPKAEFDGRKLFKRIWPKVTGGPVNVRIGSQEELGGTITWQGPKAFNPSTQRYLDFTVGGRLHAVRFESNGSVAWEVHGYDIEVEPLGML